MSYLHGAPTGLQRLFVDDVPREAVVRHRQRIHQLVRVTNP